LIQHEVGTGERSGKLIRGVEDLAGDGIERRLSRIAGDFDVTESVIGEVRFKMFGTTAAQDKRVGSFGAAQIVAIDVAVGLEDLSETQSYFGPGRSRGFQRGPTNHVLAHVEDENLGRGGRDGFGRNVFGHLDGG
jgi:hypothetical protein